MNTTTYEIPAENLHRLTEKLGALIKRAAKLGCALPSYTVSPVRAIRRTVREQDLDGTVIEYEEVREVYDVAVSGEAPSYAGWTFVAVRDHAEGGAPLIRAIDHQEIPVRFREPGSACEHCKVRRDRKETFVLRHEDGRWIQVGRSCIKDFLGHSSPDHLAACAELIAELREVGGYGESEFIAWQPTVERFLQFVAASIRLHGWTPRSRSGDAFGGVMSTAAMADAWMSEATKAAKEHRSSKFPTPNAEDRARAKAATAWAVGLTDEQVTGGKGDYLYNVRTAASRTFLTAKTTGIVASIIAAFDRDCAMKRAHAESKHVGAKGDKFTLKIKPATKKRAEERTDTRLRLTVQSVRSFDGSYGETFKNEMIDEHGNAFVWWTNAALQVSAVYMVAGTIKDHGEWRGRKETILTRCSVERVEFEVEAEDESGPKFVVGTRVVARIGPHHYPGVVAEIENPMSIGVTLDKDDYATWFQGEREIAKLALEPNTPAKETEATPEQSASGEEKAA